MAATVVLESEIRAFRTAAAFAAWLKRQHARSTAVWLRIYKKASGVPGISYAQALEEALCWGWIDGQSKSFDEASYLQRFTPRRPRSNWSKINRDHVDRLEREGRMQAAGRAQVDAAKADGRWDLAYDSPSAARVPDDFLAALAAHPEALTFYEGLNRVNHYAVAYRLQTASTPAVRQRRFIRLLEAMRAGRSLH